jgi:Delta3-Delta2-enoyl-CoA isomerase
MTTRITLTARGPVAHLTLARPRANAIDPEMVTALLGALRQVEADPEVRGLVLTGAPGMFCAGLDVVALYPLDRVDMGSFWSDFNDLMLALLATPLVTVSAISGHSPAGGCVLALMTDYRLMAEGRYKIGLNEVGVGIAMPRGVIEVFRSVVGHRCAERMGLTGALIDPAAAQAMGLIDEVVPLEALNERADAVMHAWLSTADGPRQATKAMFRQGLVERLRESKAEDEAAFLDVWFGEQAQRTLGALVEKLGGG